MALSRNMEEKMSPAKRVFIISDLHLGGTEKPVMSRPDLLATFIHWCRQKREGSGSVELVIAGDFIDFLAIEPYESWTETPERAMKKLKVLFEESSPFLCIFEELRKFIEDDHQLTIITDFWQNTPRCLSISTSQMHSFGQG